MVHFQTKLDKTFRNAVNGTVMDLADKRLDELEGLFFSSDSFPNLGPLHPGREDLLADLESQLS